MLGIEPGADLLAVLLAQPVEPLYAVAHGGDLVGFEHAVRPGHVEERENGGEAFRGKLVGLGRGIGHGDGRGSGR